MIYYMTVAHVVGNVLLEERICFDRDDLGEAFADYATNAAASGQRAEVWVLLHDHRLTDDEVCDCETYLRFDPGPYVTFNHHEAVLENDT